MSYVFGVAIESMVAVLLLLTILYCVRLNTQLRALKADEQSLKATISELITATEIAERAIADLKVTASTTDRTLGQHLEKGGALSIELGKQIEAADSLMRRLAGIVAVTRAPAPARQAAADEIAASALAAVETVRHEDIDTKAMAIAAAAFAARARLRMTSGKAA